MLEPLPDDVHPRRRRHAPALPDRAVRRGDRQPQPRVVGPVARSPAARCRSPRRAGRAGSAPTAPATGRGRSAGQHLVGQAGLVDVPVDRVEEPVHRPVGGRRPCRPGRRAAAPCDRRRPSTRPASRTPRACSVPRSRSRRCRPRFVAPDQLQRRLPPRRLRVGHARRWCGPAGRCAPATRRRPCRGSGAASGCAGRPRAPPRGRRGPARRRSAPRTPRRRPRARPRRRAAPGCGSAEASARGRPGRGVPGHRNVRLDRAARSR